MDLIEFKKRLTEKGISPSTVSYNNGLRHNTYIIDSSEGYWKVFYYDEKGNQDSSINFLTESEALLSVYDLLLKDYGC